jgi:hypothetical protein
MQRKVSSNLIIASKEILDQLSFVLSEIKRVDYVRGLPLLSDSSVGMHVRHILEFYECLIEGYDSGIINFDNRKRDFDLGNSSQYANQRIKEIILSIENKLDKPIVLSGNFSVEDNEEISVISSFNRELAYTLEHSIHHFAILKIALIQEFSYILIPKNFGLAFSTVRNLQLA